MRTSYDVCLEELRAAGVVGPLADRRPDEQFAKSLRADVPVKGFDGLLADLRRELAQQPAHYRTTPASGTVLVKSITQCKPFTRAGARKPASNPRPLVARIERKPAVAKIIAKAFGLLNGGGLSPAERGTLMLKLSELQDRIDAVPTPFSKALSAVDGDPREMKRAVIGKLKELEDHLDGAAAASHLAGAAALVETARALLDSGKLSGRDHAALSIALDDLRHKIERREIHENKR